jgi:hypothetical protein
MEAAEDRPAQVGSEGKLPWERPTVRLAGTISLLVRGGSALGKGQMAGDGDMGQFLARGQGG